jgi:hypothetical protein
MMIQKCLVWPFKGLRVRLPNHRLMVESRIMLTCGRSVPVYFDTMCESRLRPNSRLMLYWRAPIG